MVAHAGTPWAWRSRGRVVGLVAVMVTASACGAAWFAFSNKEPPWLIGSLALAASYGLLGYFFFVRPSIRSLRRWDIEHERQTPLTRA